MSTVPDTPVFECPEDMEMPPPSCTIEPPELIVTDPPRPTADLPTETLIPLASIAGPVRMLMVSDFSKSILPPPAAEPKACS